MTEAEYQGKLKTLRQWFMERKISGSKYFELKQKLRIAYFGKQEEPATIEDIYNLFGKPKEQDPNHQQRDYGPKQNLTLHLPMGEDVLQERGSEQLDSRRGGDATGSPNIRQLGI